MSIDEKTALEQLARVGVKLPSQPRVLVELQRLLSGDNCEIGAIARVAKQDPGIAALLFKAARSPAFARARNAQSLEQALVVLGTKRVLHLVQAASLETALMDDKARRVFDAFWTYIRDIAQIATIVATDRLSICNVCPDQTYLSGIFHKCGVPVLMLRFPGYCEKLRVNDAACLADLPAEDQKVGIDHCSVGHLVARHWGLPDSVCDTIRSHLNLHEEEAIGTAMSMSAILHVATHFYRRLHGIDDPSWQEIGPRALSCLGFGLDDEQDYYEEITGRFLDRP